MTRSAAKAPDARRPRTPAAGDRRRNVATDNGTRQRVLDAAVACILEQGVYRASSNAIAERAGLTWGVIQYYFGSRERLMLAVLEDSVQRLSTQLHDADLTGDTVAERISAFSDVLDRYYGSPKYLAINEVEVSLSRDPKTSKQAHKAIANIIGGAEKNLQRLTGQVLGEQRDTDWKLGGVLYHTLRGLSLSYLEVSDRRSRYSPEKQREVHSEQRAALVRALSWLVEQEIGATDKA